MTIFDLAFYLIIGAAVVFVGALIFSPGFRAKVFSFGRIKTDETYKKNTDPVQRGTDRLNQLLNDFEAQEKDVASVMTDADTAARELKEGQDKVARLKAEYARNKELNAEPSVLEACATDWQTAKDEVKTLQTAWEEADKAADDAQKDLEGIAKLLEAEKKNIKSDAQKLRLAGALNRSTDIRKKLTGLRSQFEGFKEDHDEAQRALDEARNRAKLNQGSDTDRKRKELEEQAKADAARKELEAELNGGTTTAPAPTTEPAPAPTTPPAAQ